MILESDEFQLMFPGGWLGAAREEAAGYRGSQAPTDSCLHLQSAGDLTGECTACAFLVTGIGPDSELHMGHSTEPARHDGNLLCWPLEQGVLLAQRAGAAKMLR